MSCCGKGRTQLRLAGNSSQAAPPTTGAPPLRAARIYFQYTGATSLRVDGPISGRRYLFAGPGARLEVDPRDRRSLAAVPKLVEVSW